MRYPGFTIFVVFFGISLLDALWGGHWIRALFWVGIGVALSRWTVPANRVVPMLLISLLSRTRHSHRH